MAKHISQDYIASSMKHGILEVQKIEYFAGPVQIGDNHMSNLFKDELMTVYLI